MYKEIQFDEKVVSYLQTEFQPFFNDPAVTEVVINRPGEVGVERHGLWDWYECGMTNRMLDAYGITSGNILDKKFDPYHPICMTTLPGGERATFIRNPIVENVSLTVRIPSRQTSTVHQSRFNQGFRNRVSDQTVVNRELLRLYKAGDMSNLFCYAVKTRKNIAAIGIPGSGKTAFLNAIMQEIDPDDRVIAIQDSSEFKLQHIRNRVEMIFGAAGVTASRCVEASLRMRPDRVGIQELRAEEIWGFMRILAAGYDGSFTSWHGSKEKPFAPLVFMAKQTPEGQSMKDEDIEKSFKDNIDIIVYCFKDPITKVYSTEICWFKGVVDET